MNCVLKTVVVIALASWVAYGRSILQDTVESQDISGISAANEVSNPRICTLDLNRIIFHYFLYGDLRNHF